MGVKDIIDEAVRLPAELRAALAGELLASLDGADVERDRETEWTLEIRARLDAYERGEIAGIAADDVLSELRAIARGEAT